MSLINCKVEWKLKWTKYYVLSVAGNENDLNDKIMLIILFLLSKKQNYMFLLKLYQQKRIKNYQNSLAKDMKHQFIEISIKEKMKIKMQQMNKDTFMNKMFLELIDYLF